MARPSFDEYFMLQAKLAACRSTCNSRPQGAVLVRDHRIIATGYNGALSGQKHCSEQPVSGFAIDVMARADIKIVSGVHAQYVKE